MRGMFKQLYVEYEKENKRFIRGAILFVTLWIIIGVAIFGLKFIDALLYVSSVFGLMAAIFVSAIEIMNM